MNDHFHIAVRRLEHPETHEVHEFFDEHSMAIGADIVKFYAERSPYHRHEIVRIAKVRVEEVTE